MMSTRSSTRRSSLNLNFLKSQINNFAENQKLNFSNTPYVLSFLILLGFGFVMFFIFNIFLFVSVGYRYNQPFDPKTMNFKITKYIGIVVLTNSCILFIMSLPISWYISNNVLKKTKYSFWVFIFLAFIFGLYLFVPLIDVYKIISTSIEKSRKARNQTVKNVWVWMLFGLIFFLILISFYLSDHKRKVTRD